MTVLPPGALPGGQLYTGPALPPWPDPLDDPEPEPCGECHHCGSLTAAPGEAACDPCHDAEEAGLATPQRPANPRRTR